MWTTLLQAVQDIDSFMNGVIMILKNTLNYTFFMLFSAMCLGEMTQAIATMVLFWFSLAWYVLSEYYAVHIWYLLSVFQKGKNKKELL